MRRNHTRGYRTGKHSVERYATEYLCDASRPRLQQIVNDARKTVYINSAADWDADESERIGADGRRHTSYHRRKRS